MLKTPKHPRLDLSRLRFLTAIFAFAFSLGAAAQQPSTGAAVQDLNQVLQRLQDLEGQVTALKAQVKDLKEKAAVVAPAPTSTPAPTPAPALEQAAAETMPMPGHDNEVSSPRLRLQGYGDVNWSVSDAKGSTNSFALGQFNLFITSRVTDKASFLSEAVVEADSLTNIFSIELERMELIYAVNEHLNLQFGRFHSAIGFYNTAYHHSALMQTALGRPFLFEFEDHGGILPVHTVGMSATGTVSSRLGLHYIAEIANGRDPRTTVSPVENVSDNSNGKAFNLGFLVRPPSVPGLQFGLSSYHDHVAPPGHADVEESILAGHIVYQNNRFEFLNEAVWMRHTIDGLATDTNTPGFYSQISRKFGDYRPYFRYEYLNVPFSDPLYSTVGLLHGPKAGLRYDLSEFTAFKIEYGRTMRRGLPTVNSVGTQLAFEF